MARKVTDPSFQLLYPENYYTVQGAETVLRSGTRDDIAAMRAEYTRMRDAAQKRLKRLQKQFPEAKAVKNHPNGFRKLKDMDPRDLPKAMAELKKFMKAKGSTVTGQKQIKEKTIATWQKHGLNLTEQNYDRTIKILEEMRKRKIVYGSDKVVLAADTTLELSDKDFGKLLDHLEKFVADPQIYTQYKEARPAELKGTPVNIDQMIKDLGWDKPKEG